MLLLVATLFFAPADTVTLGGVRFVMTPLPLAAGDVSLAAADINRDGHLDLLAASQSEEEMVVFEGDGTGALTARVSYPTGPSPNQLLTADVNGDGFVDVVAANHETRFVSILVGTARGTFAGARRVDVNVDPHPHAVGVRDLDGDGHLDLLVDDRNRGGLRWLRGNGDGTFRGTGELINTGGDPYLGFVMADLNGDGRTDFVTPNPRHAALTLSRGAGWQAPREIDTLAPFAVGLTDLNGDGSLDLIAASGEGARDVEVRFGPTFDRQSRVVLSMGQGPKMLAVGDLNGDGLGDAVVTRWAGEILVVMGSRSEVTSKSLPWSGNSWGVLLADFNGDGRDDIVVADGSRRGGALYLSQRR